MKLFGGTGVLGGVLGTKGYTIVEVMIFLVVSGALLVSVLGVISGQQQRTRFQTGVKDFESQLQDTLNDVETGYYPNNGDPGINEDKIFLGKGIQFFEDDTTKANTSWRETTIQAKAKTTDSPPKDVIKLSDNGADIRSNGIYNTHELINGVEITKVRYFNGSGFNDSFGVAIISGISSDGKKSSGSRGQLAKIDVSKVNQQNLLGSAVAGLSDASISAANSGIAFCLREAGGGRPAVVAVGLATQGTGVSSTGQRSVSTVYFDDEAKINFGCEE